MGVRNEDEVDGREVVDLHSRLFDAFDNLEPFRPIGINEETMLRGLDQKRCVTDPCDANVARFEIRKDRFDLAAVTFCEEGGNDNLGKKISLVPACAKLHVHMVVRFAAGAFLEEFPNHV